MGGVENGDIMFGRKHHEEKVDAEAEALAKAQAAEAVEDSETDDSSVDPDHRLEAEEEP